MLNNNMKVERLFYRKDVLFLSTFLLFSIALILLFVVVRDIFSHFSDVRIEKALQIKEESSGGMMPFEKYGTILKNNPFGFDAGELTPLTVHPEITHRQKKVSANLNLVGTIVAGQFDSFAIFRDSDGKQLLYRIKSDVPGLGILEKIERDKVVVRGDTMRELKIIEIKGGGRSVSSRSPEKKGKDVFVRRVNGNSYELNARMVQESINNPQRLMTDARLFPRYKNGIQEGFVLREVKRGGIYENLGLRNGDVLLRVNEYNITDPESALQAFTALKGVDRLQLDILRNNASVTLTYQIK